MTVRFKERIKAVPILGPSALAAWTIAGKVRSRVTRFRSQAYWEARYARGGNSGSGSYGPFAVFKAQVLNDFVSKNHINSVIEFGCGDGHQLSLSRYPQYVGIDVSPSALKRCKEMFMNDKSKRFLLASDSSAPSERAELALSLDVIYHLVEDSVYEQYMRALFGAADRFVIVYSDNEDRRDDASHVRHRRFTDWVDSSKPEWNMMQHIPNEFPKSSDQADGSWSDFWVYAKRNSERDGASG